MSDTLEDMPRIAVIPGSFDPITLGHVDVIRRAGMLFDEVHVVVVHNPSKTAVTPVKDRFGLISAALAEEPQPSTRVGGASVIAPRGEVTVAELSEGLLVDYCTRVGASVLVKGVRSAVDFDYELPMSVVNRNLGNIETVFLLPDPGLSHISSSLVRQVASLGGDITPYVPAAVSAYFSSFD